MDFFIHLHELQAPNSVQRSVITIKSVKPITLMLEIMLFI